MRCRAADAAHRLGLGFRHGAIRGHPQAALVGRWRVSLSGFTSPLWFLLLVVVAALAVGYVWMQHRRRRQVLRFANLAMLEQLAPTRQGWQRHLPLALLLTA